MSKAKLNGVWTETIEKKGSVYSNYVCTYILYLYMLQVFYDEFILGYLLGT